MQEITVRPAIHVFICVNERENKKDSCAPQISVETYKDVKLWTRLNFSNSIFVTKTGCLGFCNSEGGVVCVWPQGRFFKGIKDSEEIKKIILQEANNLKLI